MPNQLLSMQTSKIKSHMDFHRRNPKEALSSINTIRPLPLLKVMRVSLLALSLTACGEKPMDIAYMSKEITTQLSEAGASIVTMEPNPVDVSLGSQSALRSAVTKNQGYKAAIALEEAAKNRISVASSARRAQVSSSVNIGAIGPVGNSIATGSAGVAGGVTISQLLFDGGENTASTNIATAEALAAQSDRIVQGNTTALAAARAWIDFWQFNERLKLLASKRADMETLISQMERMEQNGMIGRSALESARGQSMDFSLEQIQLETSLQAAKFQFVHYFMQEPSQNSLPEQIISYASAHDVADKWRQAPILTRRVSELLIAQQSLEVIESSFRPRARLQAGLTTPLKSSESSEASIGLALDYTFADGGRRKSELNAAKLKLDSAKAAMGEEQKLLETDLNVAIDRLEALEESLPLVKKKIQLSETEIGTAQSEISTGQSDLRQLIETKIQNYRAREDMITLQAEYNLLLLMIGSRTGELGRKLGL